MRRAMDFEKCNRLGIAPLEGIFGIIDAVTDANSLANAVGSLHRLGISAFWAAFVEQDEKKSDVMALHLYQGGLGLPDRDYYINDDEKSREIRAKYLSYLTTLLPHLPGSGEKNGMAQTVMAVETRLAKASRTRVELRDVERQYNKMSPADLAKLAPKIDWPEYAASAKMPMPEYIIVGQPEFFQEVGRIFAEASLGDIKLYLRCHAINEMAGFLTEEMEQQAFDFYGRTFRGATEMRPRWRRVLDVVNSSLDEALGKLYVERHFNEDAKRKINELVDRLTVAYRARIEKLDWMGMRRRKRRSKSSRHFLGNWAIRTSGGTLARLRSRQNRMLTMPCARIFLNLIAR